MSFFFVGKSRHPLGYIGRYRHYRTSYLVTYSKPLRVREVVNKSIYFPNKFLRQLIYL